MIKVFQEKDNDCMQASMASLLDLKLEEVPPFIEFNDNWWNKLLEFIEEQNYEFQGTVYNNNDNETEERDTNIELIKDCTGVNGYFLATVRSPKYWESRKGTHMIVCDKNFNIVHDPKLEYQSIKEYPNTDILGYNGITNIMIIEKK